MASPVATRKTAAGWIRGPEALSAGASADEISCLTMPAFEAALQPALRWKWDSTSLRGSGGE
jgi:hypothetical protein